MTKIDLINKQIEQINQSFLGRDSKFLDESARNLHELRDFYYLYFQYERDKKENFFNIEKEDLVADYKELNNMFWDLNLQYMVPKKLDKIFNPGDF